MSRLDIQLDAVRTVAQQWERAANRLLQTTQQLAALRYGLDGAIQARRDIGRRLQAAYHQAADAEQRLRQLRTFLLQAAGTYSDAEDELVRRADGLTRSSGIITKRADGRVDWSGLWDSLSPRLLAYMDAVKQERYNIEGIDWSQVPPNLVDSLKASIDASARQQAELSAHTDTLDDVRHVGGYTMEGPERTRYYTDRHGKRLPVDSERMVGLIDSYNRTHGTNLHMPDVALLMSVDVTAFLRYALEQGYDPRTFQPMNDDDAREIEGYIAARQQHGEEYLRETRAWQSEALGWIPGISGAKEAADVIAGKDVLTGEPLTKLDYGLAAFSALGPLGKGAKKIVKFSADKIAGKADEVIEGMRNAGRYSGNLEVVNKPDAAADALAGRIGGQSRVKFSNDPANREFDAISDQYVAQSKPALQTVNKSVRDQMKATFEAAQETGRKVYYHFEGQPAQSVIDKLNEYSGRYGIEVVIDTKPLK